MRYDEYKLYGLKREPLLLVAALFALLFLIARANVQSITIDEAISYLDFAAAPVPAHWNPAASNHVLNTALIRLFTSIFGLSPFTARLPALIGAAIFIVRSLDLSEMLAPKGIFRLALFVCLTYNPFVQDYLVAARGYSLALGFYAAVLGVVIRVCIERQASRRIIVIASICSGLSFCSNFSFAFANLVAILALIFCCWRVPGLSRKDLFGCSLLPGLAVTILICSYTIQHWPQDQLYYGASKLKQTALSILEPSLYQPNPFLINPLLMNAFQLMRTLLPIAFLVLLVPQIFLAVLSRAVLPILLCAMLLAIVIAHLLAFWVFHLLLPLGRTGLFFATLLTLLLAALATRSRSPGAIAFRKATIVWFAAAGIYWIGCLRLSYFHEWKFDADTKSIYSVLNDLNRRQHLGNVSVDWRCAACINFYNLAHGGSLPRFDRSDSPLTDCSVYVLREGEQRPFIESQHLHIVYKGEISDMVVARRAPP